MPSTRVLAQRNGTETGWLDSFISHSATQQALEILDDDKLDREWIVRNVLGGLSAGFGLRGRLSSIAPLCVRACISDMCPL